LLDIAPSISHARLVTLIDTIERRDRPDWAPARSLCLRMTGHHGVGRFASALKAAGLFPEFTRSELEREFLRLCDEAGVVRPAMNYGIAGFEVDVHWPGTNTAIELDSHEYHSTPLTFETDRARDVKLQLMGFRVFRLTPSSFGPKRAASIELIRSLAPPR
jgi:hypothetical protein